MNPNKARYYHKSSIDATFRQKYCRQAVQLKPDDINFKKDLENIERIVLLQEQAEQATLDIRKKLGEKST